MLRRVAVYHWTWTRSQVFGVLDGQAERPIDDIIALVVAAAYCSIKPGFERIFHRNPLKTGRYATVCGCNNKCSYDRSAKYTDLSALFVRYKHQKYIPTATYHTFQQTPLVWRFNHNFASDSVYRLRSQSDAFRSVLGLNWHIPMVFFSICLQAAYTYSTFSDICSLIWYVTVCLCNNKCPCWYLSPYIKSDAFLPVFALKLTYTYGILLKWTLNYTYL